MIKVFTPDKSEACLVVLYTGNKEDRRQKGALLHGEQ